MENESLDAMRGRFARVRASLQQKQQSHRTTSASSGVDDDHAFLRAEAAALQRPCRDGSSTETKRRRRDYDHCWSRQEQHRRQGAHDAQLSRALKLLWSLSSAELRRVGREPCGALRAINARLCDHVRGVYRSQRA